jgi:hypothetical protein
MILSVFIFLLVLLIMIFCSYKKRLHLFEIFYIWMMVWIITHTVSSIIIVNLNYVELSRTLPHFWTHFFKRFLLYPLVIVMFFDLFVRVERTFTKVFLFLAAVALLVTLEFTFINLGVLINKNYNVGKSVVEWTFTLLLTYVSWLWYRHKCLVR